jgi:hypothetical protein
MLHSTRPRQPISRRIGAARRASLAAAIASAPRSGGSSAPRSGGSAERVKTIACATAMPANGRCIAPRAWTGPKTPPCHSSLVLPEQGPGHGRCSCQRPAAFTASDCVLFDSGMHAQRLQCPSSWMHAEEQGPCEAPSAVAPNFFHLGVLLAHQTGLQPSQLLQLLLPASNHLLGRRLAQHMNYCGERDASASPAAYPYPRCS